MTPPSAAKNVSRGTPRRSAQTPHARVSSTSVSPTSKTTARIGIAPTPSTRRARTVLPTGAAEWGAGQGLGLDPGPTVDLFDATQVETIDQDRVHVLLGQRSAVRIRRGIHERDEHLRGPIQQPIRLGAGEQVDRPDDPERRDLERHVVGQLVDLEGGSFRVRQRRQRPLPGQHDDQVVRIDRLEARCGLHLRGAVERGPLDVRDGDRLTLVERIGQPTGDLHPTVESPLLREPLERHTTMRTALRAGPGPVPAAAPVASAPVLLRFRKSKGTLIPPLSRCWSGSSRRRPRPPAWSCRRASAPRPGRAAGGA